MLAPGIAAGPGSAQAGYGRAPLPPTAGGRGGATTGRTVALVALGVGGGFLLLIVVLVAAVTLLGTSSSSRFSSIEGAVGPGGGGAIDDATADDGPPPMGDLDVDEAPGPLTDAGGVPVDATWSRFTSADGSFSIDFPASPTVEYPPNQVPEVSRVEVTSADVGTSEYGVVFLEFAPDAELRGDPAAFLDTYAREVNDSVGITVTSTTPGNYAYSTSVEYVGTSRRSGREARGVVFLNAKRLFVVMTVGDSAVPPDTQRFLDSLTLG